MKQGLRKYAARIIGIVSFMIFVASLFVCAGVRITVPFVLVFLFGGVTLFCVSLSDPPNDPGDMDPGF